MPALEPHSRRCAGVAITPPPRPARRARGHRPAWAAGSRSSSGRRSALAADGQASRASPQPRASTSGWRPSRPPARAVVDAAASAGGRLSSSVRRLERRRRTAGRTARHGRRSTAAAISLGRRAPAASSASEDMPPSSASQPIARPCAAAMPTRMPVKLPGPTPTRMRSALRPSSNSSIIGTSRSAWPRPISSSRARDACAGAVEQSGGAGGARRVEGQDHGVE